MSATFPETAVTLIAKIKDLGPASDSAAWVRFWNAFPTYRWMNCSES